MRDIKFRAWDKQFREWACIGLKVGEGVPPNVIELYEFQQYTGLKDKNGVEIYEGDIVKIDGFDDERKEIGIAKVIFEKGSFNTSGNGNWRNNNLYGWNYPLIVIGNIYENSDLL